MKAWKLFSIGFIGVMSLIATGCGVPGESNLEEGIKLAKEYKLKEAMNEFNEAIAKNPNYPEAYWNRAILNDKLKNTKEAVADYTRLIQIKPLYPEAFYNRGLLYNLLNDKDNAMKDFSKAIELNQTYGVAYLARAKIYYQRQEYMPCMEDLRKAKAFKAVISKSFIKNVEERTGQKLSAGASTNEVVPVGQEGDPNKEGSPPVENAILKKNAGDEKHAGGEVEGLDPQDNTKKSKAVKKYRLVGFDTD